MAEWKIKHARDYANAARRIQEKLNNVTNKIVRSTEDAVVDVALDCIGKMVPRMPVDTGDLRGSAFVDVNDSPIARGQVDGGTSSIGSPGESQNGKTLAIIGVDDQTKDYSFVQHEHTEFNHPKGGEAKFLDKTVVENIELWRKRLKNAAEAAWRGDET